MSENIGDFYFLCIYFTIYCLESGYSGFKIDELCAKHLHSVPEKIIYGKINPLLYPFYQISGPTNLST